VLTAKTTSSTFDTVLYMRMSCSDTATELYCDDQIQPDPDTISTQIYANSTYYFIVDSNKATSGTFTLDISIKPPACGDGTVSTGEECDDGNTLGNDGCDPTCKFEPKPTNDTCPGTVITLTGSGDAARVGSANGGTSSATDDYIGDCLYSAGKDVVFSFTSDVAGLAQIDLGGSTVTKYNAGLYARSTCTSDTTELACDNDYSDGADTISFNVEANKAYYVIVDGSGENGTFQINVKVSPPACGNGILEGAETCDDGNKSPGDGCAADCTLEPAGPNNTCPGVVLQLTGTGTNPRIGTFTGTTLNATNDYSGECGKGDGKDVVFAFTSDVSGSAEIDLGGATVTKFDAELYVRTTCTDTSTQVDCDDSGVGLDKLAFNATAGTTYYVFVDGYNTDDEGAFKLNVKVTPPSCGNAKVEAGEECDDGNQVNTDDCDTSCKFVAGAEGDTCPGLALSLTQNGANWEASASGSTTTFKSQYAGSCGSSSTAKDVVYRLNSGPGGKATVSLESAGTNFDSVLYVRAGDCATGSQLGCDDDYSSTGGEILTFDAAANTEYWIFVDGYSGKSGNYQLKVSVVPPVCGNGVIEGSEACDDNNTAPNDGCSSTCTWEGQCGGMAETEPNDLANAQVIPPACGTFQVSPAALPSGDADYFKVDLTAGAFITASTFVGKPGTCGSGNDTVLALFAPNATVPTTTSGGCTTSTGALVCNDDGTSISPCSKIEYTVKKVEEGTLILKAWNNSTTTPIAKYGIVVTIQ